MEHRVVLAVDIERSGQRGDKYLEHITRALSGILAESFAECRIDWTACEHQDTGDGRKVVLPPGFAKHRAIHPLMTELNARLATYNTGAGRLTQIRLRAALHAGDVGRNDQGNLSGQTMRVVARQLDAKPLRKALARQPESVPLVVLLSDFYYGEVVEHGYPGIRPEDFRQVQLAEKEHKARAWLYVPGGPADPSPEPPQPEEGATPHSVHQNVTITGQSTGFVVAGGDLYHHERD